MSPNTNTPIMKSSDGSKQYQINEALHNAVNDPQLPICMCSIVSKPMESSSLEQNMIDLMNEESFTKKEL